MTALIKCINFTQLRNYYDESLYRVTYGSLWWINIVIYYMKLYQTHFDTSSCKGLYYNIVTLYEYSHYYV